MPLTRQQVFDTAYRGLYIQGFQKSVINTKTINRPTSCRYRGANNLRCAAGWLILDKDYDASRMEGLACDENPVFDVLVVSGIEVLDVWFLTQLQQIHDAVSDIPMQDRLKSLAIKYDLIVPQIE